MSKAGVPQKLMIDASHANSSKKAENQIKVCDDIAGQIERGNTNIIGVMIESHLIAGKQDLIPDKPLTYGQSITDACISWENTVEVLERLASSIRGRRNLLLTHAGDGTAVATP
jgi:3-deoxy-7-phosphoheptulonate synthase